MDVKMFYRLAQLFIFFGVIAKDPKISTVWVMTIPLRVQLRSCLAGRTVRTDDEARGGGCERHHLH